MGGKQEKGKVEIVYDGHAASGKFVDEEMSYNHVQLLSYSRDKSLMVMSTNYLVSVYDMISAFKPVLVVKIDLNRD